MQIEKSLPPSEWDEALEFAARLIEDASLTDLCGIAAKRKRAREDAQLRYNTIQEQRLEMAAHIRAFKSRKDLDPDTVLRMIASEVEAPGCSPLRHEMLLTDAWPLAWKGFLRIEMRVKVHSNSIPPESRYVIELTDKGRERLARSNDTSTDVTCSVNSRQGNARPLHEHNREDD